MLLITKCVCLFLTTAIDSKIQSDLEPAKICMLMIL